MPFPQKFTFLSDGNTLELISEDKLGKKPEETSATYKYTKSKTKKDMEATFTLQRMNRLIEDGLIKLPKTK